MAGNDHKSSKELSGLNLMSQVIKRKIDVRHNHARGCIMLDIILKQLLDETCLYLVEFFKVFT